MDNGLELTSDGYRLHPKRSAYLTANLVGLFVGLLGVVAVGILAGSWWKLPANAPNRGDVVAVTILSALIMGSFAFVAWFTSRPPVLTVTADLVSLLGGAHRRREARSHVVGVFRGALPSRTGPDRCYFVVLTTPRAINIPVRHFDPSGLDEAMRLLQVPTKGDFTLVTDDLTVGPSFSGSPA